MNEEQSIFAEMLGIRKQPVAKPVQVVRSVTKRSADLVDMVDELDVQREVVETMALEKAELEEIRAELEAEKSRLEEETARLENEKKVLEEEKVRLEQEKRSIEEEKKSIEERCSVLEADFSELKKDLESARSGNEELEEKLARMGRSLAAARRLAAESSGVRF
jgi:chromosome segregation ATPase